MKRDSADIKLRALGLELESIPDALDRADDHDAAMALLQRSEELGKEMADIQAQSLEGLYIKARSTGWAVFDDCNPTKDRSMSMQIIASIVRDLIGLGSVKS